MAHIDEKTKRLILSDSDIEMFKEKSQMAQNKKTPVADRLIKWILTGEKSYE